MKKLIGNFLVLVLILITGGGCASFEVKGNRALEELRKQLYNPPSDNFERYQNELQIETLAFQLGEEAVPMLKNALGDFKKGRKRWHLVARSLAGIGGEKSKKILKGLYEKTGDQRVMGYYCRTIPSSPKKKDIDFMINIVNLKKSGGIPCFLALVVIRNPEAIKVLKDVMEGTPEEKRFELRWIEEGPWEVPEDIAAGDDEEALKLRVLRYGIPRMFESDRFYEESRKRLWELNGNKWAARPAEVRPWRTPYINFFSIKSLDGTRAKVSVGVTFGPLNGIGYDYWFSRIDGSWKITALNFSWIS